MKNLTIAKLQPNIAVKYTPKQWYIFVKNVYHMINTEMDHALEAGTAAYEIYPTLVVSYEFFRLIRGELFDDVKPHGLGEKQTEIYHWENNLCEKLSAIKQQLDSKEPNIKQYIKEVAHWFDF